MVQANATKLRSVRVRKHYSQEALEEASGVSQTVISKLERTGPTVGVAHAIAIAKALGTTVEDLFADDAARRHLSTRGPVRPRELTVTQKPRRSRAS